MKISSKSDAEKSTSSAKYRHYGAEGVQSFQGSVPLPGELHLFHLDQFRIARFIHIKNDFRHKYNRCLNAAMQATS